MSIAQATNSISAGHARYLVAKYAPDLWRMEPRNIGVIVWWQGHARAQFFDDPPPFVCSKHTYENWVFFWNRVISEDLLTSETSDDKIPLSSPGWIDALKSTEKQEYMLSDEGFIFDEVTDIDSVTRFLFASLVAQPESRKEKVPRPVNPRHRLAKLIKESELYRNPHYQHGVSIECNIVGTQAVERFKFAHAINNGAPKHLIDTTSLPFVDSQMPAVHNLAWKFLRLIQANRINREGCHSVVQIGEEERNSSIAKTAVDVLSGVSNVIDVSNEEQALEKLREISRLSMQ